MSLCREVIGREVGNSNVAGGLASIRVDEYTGDSWNSLGEWHEGILSLGIAGVFGSRWKSLLLRISSLLFTLYLLSRPATADATGRIVT